MLGFLSLQGVAVAHFHILIPENPLPKKGDEVRVVYRFGHPFEHEIQDAAKPARGRVICPDGKVLDISQRFQPFKDREGKRGFSVSFMAEQRGDYVLVAESPPFPFSEVGEFLQDTTKVVVHVQSQKNWDAGLGQLLEIQPLNRPYGIFPGMAVNFRLADLPKDITVPAKGWLFEWEKFNHAPPKDIPSPEWVTFSAKGDDRGRVTVTPNQLGWWVVSTTSEPVEGLVDGKKARISKRTSFWFHVGSLQEGK